MLVKVMCVLGAHLPKNMHTRRCFQEPDFRVVNSSIFYNYVVLPKDVLTYCKTLGNLYHKQFSRYTFGTTPLKTSGY